MTTAAAEPISRMLGGGVPAGNSVLIVSEPMVESGAFGLHFVSSNAPSKRFLFVLTRTKEATLKKAIDDYGLSSIPFEAVDCFSARMNEPSTSKYVVENPRDYADIRATVLKAIDDTKGCFFFVEDLNAIVEYVGAENANRLVAEWAGRIKALGGIGAFVYTNWQKADPLKAGLADVMDCVISLNALERRVVFGQSFLIEKAGWTRVENVAIPFKILKPGGVRVFVPKILVTGPYNAGKSSFIHSASTRAVSVDRIGTTVALDHGHMDYKGFSADLFGTPGQERFDPILDTLGGEAVGVVIVVDSTDPDSFPRAVDMMHKTNAHGLPCAIVANKADLPGALGTGDIRKKLGVDASTPIIPVHAEDIDEVKRSVGKVHCRLKKEDVNAVLDALFELIFFKKGGEQ